MVTPGRFRARAAVVLFLTLVSAATAKYSGGSGTAQDPYQIATAADLIALGETPADYEKHFILTANIDLDPKLPGRKVFDKAVIAPDKGMPSGYRHFQGTSFTGVFDGKGHTISHLTITGQWYLGLFGRLESGAEIKNLGAVDIKIGGSGGFIGGLVGQSYKGRVARCCSTGSVSGSSWIGALMGESSGDVTHCYSTGVVSGAGFAVGGLVGANGEYGGGRVIHCYSTGAVNGNTDVVGGLVGSNYGDVLRSVWDTETSGLLAGDGGVGLTTVEMMNPYMLGLNGFANDPNWLLDASRDYPRLAWEGTAGQIIPEPNIDWLAGQGTAEDPYRIDTAKQLVFLGRASALCDSHIVLGADIDLDPNLVSIRVFPQAVIPTFMGVFDGGGHTILHLTIAGHANLGLFGQLESGAEVKKLGIVDVNITSSGAHVGGLVGRNDGGCISGCWSAGSITGGLFVGGLVGANGDHDTIIGVVTCCYSTGTVSGTQGVGGLVGWNSGAVTQSYSASVVSGNWSVGGLVGGNSGAVTQSYSAGVVSGTYEVGGLVGDNGGTVTQCYSTGAVSGTSEVGGLVGINFEGSITTSYNTGAVSGKSYVGGLVGENWAGDVTQCYSTGTVSGTQGVGGLVGWNDGGFVGGIYQGTATVSFWDIQTSGQAASAGGIGKTTAEMQTAKTFLDAGWDFVGETKNGTEDIWWILEGKDYPRLWWEAAKK